MPQCLLGSRLEQAELRWCPATSGEKEREADARPSVCVGEEAGPALSIGQSSILLFSPKPCFAGTERCSNLPKGTQQVWVPPCSHMGLQGFMVVTHRHPSPFRRGNTLPQLLPGLWVLSMLGP